MRTAQQDADGTRTIRGRVTSAGVVERGSGFTAQRTSTGSYTVRFAQPCRAILSANVTADAASNVSAQTNNSLFTADSIAVGIYNTSNAVLDASFNLSVTVRT